MHEARHVAFALAVDCPRCEHSLALPPLQSVVTCGRCELDIELPDRVWIGVLRLAEELHERLGSRHRASVGQRTIAGLQVHYAIWRQLPSCERCGAELEQPRAVAPSSETRADRHARALAAGSCPGCREPVLEFAVPPAISGAVTAAKQVFVCDPHRFASDPARLTWTLRLCGPTPAWRRRALELARRQAGHPRARGH